MSALKSAIHAAILIAMVSCTAPVTAVEREERPRFKGVELYSWQDAEGGWVFALVDGTNRLKSGDVIRGDVAHQVEGVRGLEAAFARLAVGEQVFWLHHVEGFEFPVAEVRAEIAAAARAARVDLAVGAPE